MPSTDDKRRTGSATNGTRRRPIPPPPPRRRPPDQPASRVTDPDAEPGRPSTTVVVRPWVDPAVDESGHDPRSRYVELFWLGVLGPTATWLVRRLVAGLEQQPHGYVLDLEQTAKAMGLSYSAGRSSPFSKALQRCAMFGLTHQTGDGLAVRRRLPRVAYRHLRRMPDAVRHAHDEWISARIEPDEFERAHRISLTLLDTGDDAGTIEHHLVALGVSEAIAAAVADNATRL